MSSTRFCMVSQALKGTLAYLPALDLKSSMTCHEWHRILVSFLLSWHHEGVLVDRRIQARKGHFPAFCAILVLEV